MLRMIARRASQTQVGAGTDRVIFGISLPSDTVINRIQADVSVVGENIKDATVALWYAMRGYILPVHDPDATLNFDTLWDQLVPKDTDTQTIDLDTVAVDTSPFFDVGLADWTKLLDIGLRPRRIYNRERMMTIMTHAQLRFQDNVTPFLPRWVAGDAVKIDLRQRMYVRQPSVLVFGVASPSVGGTTSSVQSALTEVKWGQVKFMGDTLKRGLMSLIGLTEAGAETPWDEAVDLLQEHLDPDPFELTAGRWGADTWNVFTRAMIDHSVRGEIGVTTVSA